MDLSDVIIELLEHEGISQKVLAERAKVDQSTVSRALKRQPSRRTAAYARLCRYMQQYAAGGLTSTNPALDAVRKTWDGSAEHAAALAKLILASDELWPRRGRETAP